MNKKDIMLLFVTSAFNPNQCWVTYIPYDKKLMYGKSDKFNGLKMFNLEKTFRHRIDSNLIDKLDVNDFLCKATLVYDLVDVGTLNPIVKVKQLIVGNKTFDI